VHATPGSTLRLARAPYAIRRVAVVARAAPGRVAQAARPASLPATIVARTAGAHAERLAKRAAANVAGIAEGLAATVRRAVRFRGCSISSPRAIVDPVVAKSGGVIGTVLRPIAAIPVIGAENTPAEALRSARATKVLLSRATGVPLSRATKNTSA
jgi:hypothetical protein